MKNHGNKTKIYIYFTVFAVRLTFEVCDLTGSTVFLLFCWKLTYFQFEKAQLDLKI